MYGILNFNGADIRQNSLVSGNQMAFRYFPDKTD